MSKTKRLKSENGAIRSKDEFERLIDEIAVLDTRRRILEAKRDKELQEVQDARNPDILAAKERADLLLERCQAYAADHREELFRPGRKTAESSLATYGFRDHPPAVVLAQKKGGWDRVLELLRGLGRLEFVRTKEEVDKERVKAEWPAERLGEIGLKLETRETFGVTPKTESGERGVA